MKEIKLTRGKVAFVDDDDFEELNRFKWQAAKDHNLDKYYAVGSTDNKKSHKMHRFIMRVDDPKIVIDHKDGNTLNNQKCNLRIASLSQNKSNLNCLLPQNKSGYRGVSFNKATGKWTSSCRRVYLGRFNTTEEAAKAFDKKAKELFGEFCGKLNFE